MGDSFGDLHEQLGFGYALLDPETFVDDQFQIVNWDDFFGESLAPIIEARMKEPSTSSSTERRRLSYGPTDVLEPPV